MTRTIQTLDRAGITTLLAWAATEGWNPGLHDAPAFEAADPNGFFGAFVDGTLVAGIAAVAYDAHFGFIGLYICHPDWRGQGHGKAVWDVAMAYLGDRTIGLDGVPEQQANYAGMGFVPAYETIRMSGTRPSRPEAIAPEARDLQDLLSLDRQHFPAPREAFLRHWIAPPNRLAQHLTNGAVTGYAVTRDCIDGAKIGPLFATDLAVATYLLDAQSGPLQIDVPAAQIEWLQHLTELGFSRGFQTCRMYRGPQPAIDLSGVFGISSLELG